MSMQDETQDQSGTKYDRLVLTNTLILAVVFLCYFFTSYRMGEDAQTIGVIALLGILVMRPRWTTSSWLWLVVLGSLLYTLFERPLDVPNHHFMMSYLGAAMVLVFAGPKETWQECMMRNARWMLVVLMAFATVHKVVSPTFRDGSYLGYEIVRGGFGDPVLSLFGDIREVTAENDRLIKEFRQTPPTEIESIQLKPPVPNLQQVAYGFALSILAIELWLCLGFLFAPNWLLSHLSLLSFILSLGVLRQEFTFISVVCAMGLMACNSDRSGLRPWYAGLAILCAAAILKTMN